MAGLTPLVPAMLLLSVLIFACMYALYKLMRVFEFNRVMKSLASDLTLNYAQTVVFRAPSVGGNYKNRAVAVDVVGKGEGRKFREYTRVRAFHSGELEEDFTVGGEDYFSGDGKTPKRVEVDNDAFRRGFRVLGGRTAVVKKFLDDDLQKLVVSADIPFTVGKHDVSYVESGHLEDKQKIIEVMDFLVEAALRADRM